MHHSNRTILLCHLDSQAGEITYSSLLVELDYLSAGYYCLLTDQDMDKPMRKSESVDYRRC
jgi:hypothetical protein